MMEPKLIPTDEGRALMARKNINPRAQDGGRPDTETLATELGVAMTELLRLCPEDHFIKYAKIECDGLREGLPRGGRFHLVIIFQPVPEHRNR